MRERPAGGELVPRRPRQDIVLDVEDREELLQRIARMFGSDSQARRLLGRIRFPAERIPHRGDDSTPVDWWDLVFAQLEEGAVEQGFRRLLDRAVRDYPGDPRLFDLYQRYTATAQDPDPEPDRGADTCHVFLRLPEEEREAARALLAGLGLDPQEELATDYIVSYAVASTDQAAVRTVMSRTDLPWTVASPTTGHYLLHSLVVQGPDGSRFQLRDTPAAVTLGTIAQEVVASQYAGQDSQAVRETVVNRVHEDGQQERMNPDQTLEEAQVPDGAQVQVAFGSRAGGTPPSPGWEVAIARAGAQITGFARQQRIRLVTNRQYLPTRFDLHFTQPSFGPPPAPGEPPVRVSQHTVRLLLLDGFPAMPPRAFWLTPFFHPNVFPTYDCARARSEPAARGLVCLGELAAGWYPALDLAEVCRVILDIAAYRNYDVFGVTTADLSMPAHVNFYDPDAAMWAVMHHQDIEGMGGSPLLPVLADPPRVFRTTILPMSQEQP
jgi:Effector-associated domain 1